MKKPITTLLVLAAVQLHAQNIGIGTNTPLARLHVVDSNVLFTGTAALPPLVSAYNPPQSGAGTRFMWYASLGALRAGYVNGTQWDKINIGRLSVAIGHNGIARGEASIALGLVPIATADYAVSIGYNNTASGLYATALGAQTIASGIGATSMGNQTQATGPNAVSMGLQTTASGFHSTSMGYQTTAGGDISTSMGQQTLASAQGSTAMGSITTASGISSTSMGNGTIASGFTSTAMGNGTIASGWTSTAMGYLSEATNDASTASGWNTLASGFNSFTGGIKTKAKSNASFSIGSWNDSTDAPDPQVPDATDRLFQIGNGDETATSNAITVLRNGNTGIGTLTPSEKLHVIGNILASGTITPSDIRYKKNIQTINSPLAKLQQLNGVTYQFNQTAFPEWKFDDKLQYGLIAQEVEKVFPEMVKTIDKKGYMGVEYVKLIPVLLEAIKEQQAGIKDQQTQITELKKLVQQLLNK